MTAEVNPLYALPLSARSCVSTGCLKLMTATLAKAHTSALCLIPPRAVWERIQDVRCFNDRNFIRRACAACKGCGRLLEAPSRQENLHCRWPPHINLIYPYVTDIREDLGRAAEIAADALRDVEPFEVGL